MALTQQSPQGMDPSGAVSSAQVSGAQQVQGDNRKPANDRQAPIFANILNNFSRNTTSSAEAMAYIELLRKELSDPSRKIVINMKQLNNPGGSVVFYHKTTGIILIFDEAVRGYDTSVPTSDAIMSAIADCRRNMPEGFRILNAIIVDTLMYSKARVMVNHITSLMEAQFDSSVQDFKIEDMASSRFTVDNDINNVMRFITENSPHAVPARGNIGFTINIRQEQHQATYQTAGRPPERYTPVMGCIAYVEMIKSVDNQGGERFQPLVHITDIVSLVPTNKVCPIIVSVAADIFLVRQMWKHQFSQFEPGKPNIGNYIQTEDGTPWFATSIKAREVFIQNYVNNPALAIDVTEGRARIPGIEKYADPRAAGSIRNEYAQFLGLNFTSDVVPTTHLYDEFVGIVEQGSQQFDSREVDYMSTIQHLGNNPKLAELLVRAREPHGRANLILDLMSNFKRLYINQVCVFDATMIESIGRYIIDTLNLAVTFDTINTIDMNAVLRQAKIFSTGAFNVTSSTPAFNRGNPNYHMPGGGMFSMYNN